MKKAPKSLRLQIGLFGRTNVGKSSFLNMVCGQDFAITSEVPGTTTDVVEKSMELLPVGPVVFLDTAGVDDKSVLSELRVNKTRKIFDRADISVLIVEPDAWGEYEDIVVKESNKRNIPLIIVVNKIDSKQPQKEFINKLKSTDARVLLCSSVSVDKKEKDSYINTLKKHIIACCPDDFINPPPIMGDLIPEGGLALLVIPIDFEAPKGRIILPQVQAIRDLLDNDQAALIIKENQIVDTLKKLVKPPDIVACDSQAIAKVSADIPSHIPVTTFSILFSRYKADLAEAAAAVTAVKNLKDNDKILIAEACSHHPIEGDIGRIKIPNWFKQYTNKDLKIDVCSGRDWPDDIKDYKLIVHCGACMITRREMLCRVQKAKENNIPMTNYGVVISALHKVLERTLLPFPEALKAFKQAGMLKEEAAQ